MSRWILAKQHREVETLAEWLVAAVGGVHTLQGDRCFRSRGERSRTAAGRGSGQL